MYVAITEWVENPITIQSCSIETSYSVGCVIRVLCRSDCTTRSVSSEIRVYGIVCCTHHM